MRCDICDTCLDMMLPTSSQVQRQCSDREDDCAHFNLQRNHQKDLYIVSFIDVEGPGNHGMPHFRGTQPGFNGMTHPEKNYTAIDTEKHRCFEVYLSS